MSYATALASILRSHVCQRVIAFVAALDGLVDGSLAGPTTRSLTAVPVPCCPSGATLSEGGSSRQSEEGDALKRNEHDGRVLFGAVVLGDEIVVARDQGNSRF